MARRRWAFRFRFAAGAQFQPAPVGETEARSIPKSEAAFSFWQAERSLMAARSFASALKVLQRRNKGVTSMKSVSLSAAILLLGVGTAIAGGGAPVPEKPEGGPPSGRPGPVLDDTKCTAAWEMTEREGDTLAKDKAVPFIVNFEMVDTSGDGKITQDEFKDGCGKGLVQEQASKPADSGGGQTPEDPEKKM
jgi:hypothetical protein